MVFRGTMPKTELARLMQRVDAGLMVLANIDAFYFGTSPNKFFDYISAGLPVINNYPGWLAGLIETHRCGVTCRPDDPASFADALIRLADDPDEARAMGRRARQLAESEFDRQDLADRFVDRLEAVVETTGRRSGRAEVTAGASSPHR